MQIVAGADIPTRPGLPRFLEAGKVGDVSRVANRNPG